jgi:DNA-binding LytR/AlgR family response regulator
VTAPPAEPGRLRALVVEDEWMARRYLVELLQASGRAEVVAAVATLEEAREALGPDGVEVDVAFVDIHLGGPDGEEAGLALVRALAGQPGAPLLVLATALSGHAVEAYALGVADYLLKPFSQERVDRCLVRLSGRRPAPNRSARARVVARSRRGLVLLDLDEVWAFEATGRLTFVHSARGRFDVDLSLAALEASLGGAVLRVHRQWLVRVDRVLTRDQEEGGETVVQVGEAGRSVRVPVARDRRSAVRELLLAGATGLRP